MTFPHRTTQYFILKINSEKKNIISKRVHKKVHNYLKMACREENIYKYLV